MEISDTPRVEKNFEVDLDSASWNSDDGGDHQFSMRTRKLSKISIALTNSVSQADNLAYFYQGTLKLDDIVVTVADIGKLTFPIDPECAENLKNVASLALYGQGQNTKLDVNIRNTYVIPADKLDVKINNLDFILEEVCSKLQLESNCVLEPHLYNLLVYEPGQFFKFHRDTEKFDSMVATMVICVPSPHLGGDLVIEHLTGSHKFSTENISGDRVDYIAFYADCRHKVNKVKEGYRIVLTYNLVLKKDESVAVVSEFDKDLYIAIENFFTNNTLAKAVSENSKVNKLVYLLEHKYSRNGLQLKTLKGHDRIVLNKFIEIAKKLRYKLYLAKAQIKETWTGHRDWDNGASEFENFSTIEAELSNMISFISGNKHKGTLDANSKEICWTKNNSHLKAFNIKHEFTGNWGCSEKKWYDRAALVLLPPKRAMEQQGKTASNEVGDLIQQIDQLIETSGNESTVAKILQEVTKSITLINSIEQYSKNYYYSIAKATIYINNEENAFQVLKNICDSIFKVEFVDIFVELKSKYGEELLGKLLGITNVNEFRCTEFTSLANNLIEKGFDKEFCCKIIDHTANQIIECHSSLHLFMESEPILENIASILKVYLRLENADKIKHLTEVLNKKPYSIQNMITVFKACFDSSQSFVLSNKQLQQLEYMRTIIVGSLKTDIDKYMEQSKAKDWSIQVDIDCSCEVCKQLNMFLKSPTEISMTLTLSRTWEKKHLDLILKKFVPQVTCNISEIQTCKIELVKKPEVGEAAARTLDQLRKALADVENLLDRKSLDGEVLT